MQAYTEEEEKGGRAGDRGKEDIVPAANCWHGLGHCRQCRAVQTGHNQVDFAAQCFLMCKDTTLT